VDHDGLLEAFAGFPIRLDPVARAAAGDPVATSAAGEWGPSEVVRHLIAVEREVHQTRLAHVASEDDPHWVWTEPGLEPGLEGASLDALLSRFAAARAATVDSVRALDDAGWQRHGTHATYGVLDVAGLIHLAMDHDEDHLTGLRTRA
jgi:hypothetical protein